MKKNRSGSSPNPRFGQAPATLTLMIKMYRYRVLNFLELMKVEVVSNIQPPGGASAPGWADLQAPAYLGRRREVNDGRLLPRVDDGSPILDGGRLVGLLQAGDIVQAV